MSTRADAKVWIAEEPDYPFFNGSDWFRKVDGEFTRCARAKAVNPVRSGHSTDSIYPNVPNKTTADLFNGENSTRKAALKRHIYPTKRI